MQTKFTVHYSANVARFSSEKDAREFGKAISQRLEIIVEMSDKTGLIGQWVDGIVTPEFAHTEIEPTLTTWNVEHTDTFGGEANYSWVNRASFEMPEHATQRDIVRKAKELIGETGNRNTTDYYNGDTYELNYPGRCVRTFITAQY
jgi:hypothetical protein